MFKKKIFTCFIFLFVFIVLQLIFCSTQCIYAANIKISSTSKTLPAGYGMKLNITGTNKKIKWTSDDTNIAIVSGNGYVTAINVGETTVKATVANKNYKCKIKVNSNAHVEICNSKKIAFTGVYSKIKYKSNNTKIAIVDKNGKVTGKKTGKVKITAKVNGKKFSYNLIVDASRMEKGFNWKYILL